MREAVLEVPGAVTRPNTPVGVEKSDNHKTAEHREDLAFSKWWQSFSSLWDRTIEVVLLKRALAGVGDETCAVDVGCGDMSLFGRGLLNLPKRYFGIEPNRRLLREARKRFPSAKLICSRGSSSHFGVQCADVILSLWVLHISGEIPSIIRECRRVGRSQSKLVITLPDLNSQLYSEIRKLTGILFPRSHIPDPDELLREHHALVFKALEGCNYEITHFSGTVFLPREPSDRITPLIDFVHWLLPNRSPLDRLLQHARAEAKDFATMSSPLEDKGLLIEASLP